MQIGIFAKTFNRPSLNETLDAVLAHGLNIVQFNMACAQVESMPETISPEFIQQIRSAHDSRAIAMAAVSGTFNMAHPDPAVRKQGLKRFNTLAAASRSMGTRIITLCTGSRDPENMWRRHPENDSAEAWNDMRATIAKAVEVAEAHNVTIAFEPEVSNIVDTAEKGLRLLKEVQSPRLKVVMDGANLFHDGELARMREVLDNAFQLLGDSIVLAHAKDLARDGEAGHEAAGSGMLDYDHYLALLREFGYTGPLILHGLNEQQVPTSIAFLTQKLARFRE
jgi:sugar phosphate isomerase/epimerase